MGAVVFIFYGSIVFFVIAALIKLNRYIRAPIHLRWEYYRGSSVYEQSEWWTKGEIGFIEKLKSVVLDIFLQREYYNRNRSFWYLLIIFHSGLYLLILWHAWLFLAALVMEVETAPTYGIVWGHIATALVLIGGAGVLIRRLTDVELKSYYNRMHYLKWVFILVTLVGGFYSVQFHFEGSSIELLRYVNKELQFDFSEKMSPAVIPSLHVLFISAWLIYLPFSHVMQIIFRYYHELRWDHVQNTRGSGLEKRINELLGKRVSWADSHIQTGKTWGEVATQIPGDKSGSEGK